ncbi:MAG: two pore domain potassium channel family protein [Thermoanaerobaculia bacterium]
MRILLGLLGIGILLVTIYDVLWTTLRLTSGGPITSWVTDELWKLSVRMARSYKVPHKVLATLGFLIVLFTVVLWVLLVWTGWTLVMEMSPRAVLESATGRPADLWSRIYFAGSTIITMNVSEYRPGSAGWRIVSTIAAANGFSMVSLIITYLLPIVGAELERRRLAVYITALGRTPYEILLRAWNGSSFGKLPDHLIALTLPMLEIGQGHLAYPVLHCIHSSTRETALAPSVAVLDEAITLFAGVCPEQRPDKCAFYPLRQAIAEFLSTLAEAHLEPKREPPPPPPLDPLREAGITTVKDEEFRLALETLADRRRLLLGLVEEEAWRWEDVMRSNREIVKRMEISDL